MGKKITMTHKTTALILSQFAFYFYCCDKDYDLKKTEERVYLAPGYCPSTGEAQAGTQGGNLEAGTEQKAQSNNTNVQLAFCGLLSLWFVCIPSLFFFFFFLLWGLGWRREGFQVKISVQPWLSSGSHFVNKASLNLRDPPACLPP